MSGSRVGVLLDLDVVDDPVDDPAVATFTVTGTITTSSSYVRLSVYTRIAEGKEGLALHNRALQEAPIKYLFVPPFGEHRRESRRST